jgi:hypothetical protein
MKILPKTKTGLSSIIFALLMPLTFKLGFFSARNIYPATISGETITKDISSRPFVALPMLAGFLFGILAFTSGIYAIVKNHEKSPLTFTSSLIGLLLILFLLGEIISPH